MLTWSTLAARDMNILITGGTGSIGSGIVRALCRRGHAPVALARSAVAAARLRDAGCRVAAGDLQSAAAWLPSIGTLDAVIHAAATFDADMAAVDAGFLRTLVPWLREQAHRREGRPRLIYTGGAWLYGAVGNRTAVEGTAFNPPPDFAYMVEQRERLLADAKLSVCIVHPAMVWHDLAGVLSEFASDARNGWAPRITADGATRWPMVHRDDLAELYCLVVERGRPGADYHGVAEVGVAVGAIAAAIATRFSSPAPHIESVEQSAGRLGSWAACRAFDQTMDAPLTRSELGWQPRQPPVLRSIAG